MSKGTFGIVAGLALSLSPAWAGDERSDAKGDERAASDAVASLESTKASQGERAAGSVVEVASDHRAMAESKDVRASHEERWLLEREGYRDGGY